MISCYSLVRTNKDTCEYPCDLMRYKDFRCKMHTASEYFIIKTEYDSITLTGDHQVQLDTGLWKYVDQLQVSDCLKNIYNGRTFITGITHLTNNPHAMYNVINMKHSYNIVNGFHVSQ